MFIRIFTVPLNASLVELSLDIAELASDKFAICPRSIQHLATVFMFKVIGADIENVLVRRMLQVSFEVSFIALWWPYRII